MDYVQNYLFKERCQNGEKETAPLYDDTHFDFPTYILQWTEVNKKWEVLEYVMLDNQNRTVVFVYTMSELEYIEKNSAYKYLNDRGIIQ